MRRRLQRLVPFALGVALGSGLVLTVPLIRGWLRQTWGDAPGLEPLPEPQARVQGDVDGKGTLPVSGDVRTTIDDFAMDDPDGRRVLRIERVEAEVNADALRRGRLHMPVGKATGIHLLLRRGRSGRVSITESVNDEDPGDAEPEPNPEGMLLDIGPLEARDIRLTIAMSDSPVVVHLTRARLRVQRTRKMDAPRIFLSDIQGRLVKPDPLPKPIEIHDGKGVVDLGEGPLVDMRVRVCLARGELRLRIEVPTRDPEVTHLTTDADRFMGRTAMAALGVVDWFKDTLSVKRGPVEVPGGRKCEGRTGN